MDLVEAIRNAGVVGAGGAGFPAHVKAGARADTVIANGAECEPVLVTDRSVMASHAAEVIQALRAVGARVGARRLVLALKAHYRESVDAARPFLEGEQPVELCLLGDTYPSGDEHVLVHEVTGRVVPEGGIPPDVSVVVQNVTTLLNIRRAMDGIPVTRRPLTVAGDVSRPGVYEVPVGISCAEVVSAAGGATGQGTVLVEGGPMMGLILDDWDTPVRKTTSGLLVLAPDHPVVTARSARPSDFFRRALSVCCQCRACTDQCPRALLGHRIRPHLAMRALLAGRDIPSDILAMGYLCSQCGVCETWACPMGLSPRYILGDFKSRLFQARAPNPYRDRPEQAQDTQAWIRVPKGRLAMRLGLGDVHPTPGTPIPVKAAWEVRIPLKQHVGAPALAIVRKGERVGIGQCIGDIPQGALGARIHASMDGVVTFVDAECVRISREA